MCKQKTIKLIFSLLLTTASHNVYSNEQPECKLFNSKSNCILFSANGFRFDNDLFDRFDNDDRNYTYGVFWNWGNEVARRHVFHTETIQNFLLDDILNKKDWATNYAFQFGITNFTPDNLSRSEVENQDRPYANLIFVHSDVYKVSPDNKTSLGVGTTFGIMGTSIGGALQSGWHSFLREATNDNEPVAPNGWHNQISDGGELTAKISLSYNKRYQPSEQFDMAWSLDTSIGYYTFTSVGGVLRFGTLDKNSKAHDVINLSSPVSAGEKLLNINNSQLREKFFFVGIRQVYMGYNVMLQCQFKDSNFCLENNQIEKNITEWSFGFKTPFFKFWDIGENTNLIFSWHGRTAEHKLENARNHQWGGFTLEWVY